MYKNQHLYCKDLSTGIIYRTVGLTNTNKLMVYPKYLPSINGNRGKDIIKYEGVRFPIDSIKYINKDKNWISENVKLDFNEQFNVFIPTAERKKVYVYEPTELMKKRSKDNSDLIKHVNQLVQLFCKASNKLKLEYFGIDASILVGLENQDSDIDLIIHSPEKAQEAHTVFNKLIKDGNLKSAIENKNFFLQRRQAYSPLMSEDEILLWESRKISGIYKNRKFSILPKNLDQIDSDKYIATNQTIVLRCHIKSDLILFDPGYLDFEKQADNIEVVWGPSNLKLSKFITYLPSKTGTLLKQGDTFFMSGKLYKQLESNKFIVGQFPWDENFFGFETNFLIKIEKVRLDNMLPAFYNLS